MSKNETGMTLSLSHLEPLGVTFSLSIDSIANTFVMRKTFEMAMEMKTKEILINLSYECTGHDQRTSPGFSKY